MTQVFGLAILVCISCCFIVTEGVQCYQCAYIEGVKELNGDCLDNVKSGTVKLGGGLACLKAEGLTSDGRTFVIRRSFRPTSQDLNTIFPTDQQALSCQEAAKYGNRQMTAASLSVTIIGDKPVKELTSCVLCNDKDECNLASNIKLNVVLFFATLGLIVPLMNLIFN